MTINHIYLDLGQDIFPQGIFHELLLFKMLTSF